jgi:hypothetical protein
MLSLCHSLTLNEESENKRTVAFQVFDQVSKKTFVSDIQGLIFGSVVSTNNTIDEETALSDVVECYDAALDFVEALVELTPEKYSISHYGAAQKNMMMRALFYAVRQRCKEKGTESVHPFSHVKTTDDVRAIKSLNKCPLFFILLFEYMIKHDTVPEGGSSSSSKLPYLEKVECRSLLTHFRL